MDADLIEPAFIIGKGINFIRKCLLDGEWSLDLAALAAPVTTSDEKHDETKTGEDRIDTGGDEGVTHTKLQQEQLGFLYTLASSDNVGSARLYRGTPIRRTLQRAATLVHSHILTSLHEKYSLLHHIFALKQFLLLGQGDFFSALMDGIHSEFKGRTGIVGIYRHSLAAIVETALRNTNANGFPDNILGRLQVELLLAPDDNVHFQFGLPLQKTTNDEPAADQRTVWDIFLLEYKVPDPVLAVVHPEAMEQYKRMFLFLFGLRKVEFLLNLTWRESAVLQHALQATAQYNGLDAANCPEYAKSIVLLRHISMTRQAMIHFVVNLKSYLMFEVLEGEWKELLRTMREAETLDEAIEAHDGYLDGVCRKSLLVESASTNSGSSLSANIKNLLRLANEFCRYQEQLLGTALQAAERAAEKRRVAEDRLEQGQWGFSSEKERAEEGSFFGLADAENMEELERLSREFNHQVVVLLNVLDVKLNGGPVYDEEPSTPGTPGTPSRDTETNDEQGDLDALRFLAFQLDSNKFYSVQTAGI